jgi:hypothetical protein
MGPKGSRQQPGKHKQHHPQQSVAVPVDGTVNDALPDLVTIQILLSCRQIGDPLASEVWQYDARTVLKRSGSYSAEAAAMSLVRERTSIPVPRVLKSIKQPGEDFGYIFMEHVDGEPLDQAWSSCDEAQRQNIVAQLRGYFRELRQIRGQYIGSVDGSVCNDQIFPNRAAEFGPYKDEDSFRAGIADSLRACDADPT